MTQSPETSSTKDQAQQAAGTAADEGRHVAGVAADEARGVAGEAKAHAKGLLDETMGQIDEQTRTQRDRVATTLQSFSDDLDTMADDGGTSGLAAELAKQAAERARALGQHLDGREPSDLLDDVRQFARRRPGAFLAGALVAGVVAGRLARGAQDADSSQTASPAATPTTTTTSPSATGSAFTTSPAPVPVISDPTSTPGRLDPDPLGADDPAAGAIVPPTAPSRYEP